MPSGKLCNRCSGFTIIREKKKFLPGLETEIDLTVLTDSNIVKLVQYANSKKLILQVTQVCDSWYALNSLALCVYQHLQHKGCITSVPVQKVSASSLPPAFLKDIEKAAKSGLQSGGGRSGQLTGGRSRVTLTWDPQPPQPHTESDDDDDEGSKYWTCSVCDERFSLFESLEDHQTYYRHYGCHECDSEFDNIQDLNLHKERMDHWSEDEFSKAESLLSSEDEKQEDGPNEDDQDDEDEDEDEASVRDLLI